MCKNYGNPHTLLCKRQGNDIDTYRGHAILGKGRGLRGSIFRAAWMRKDVAPASKKPHGCGGSYAA